MLTLNAFSCMHELFCCHFFQCVFFSMNLYFADPSHSLFSYPRCLLTFSWETFHFRYVAIDNLKRGDMNGPTSVIAHTSVPFGIKNIEVTPDAMKEGQMYTQVMKGINAIQSFTLFHLLTSHLRETNIA